MVCILATTCNGVFKLFYPSISFGLVEYCSIGGKGVISKVLQSILIVSIVVLKPKFTLNMQHLTNKNQICN